MSSCRLYPLTEPSRGNDENDASWAGTLGGPRPVDFDGRRVDQMLLDAFAGARRRLRGAIVAISERTMMTNAGASELLQPEDRRLLWQQLRSGECDATERDVPFVLANGMTVHSSCYPVGSDGRLVGVVLHLRVPRPTRVRLDRSLTPDLPEAGVTLRSLPPTADAALFSGWSDLTDSERTVAELAGQGLSNKQTGRKLFMSPHTVDSHLRRIYRKLGINSRVELARLLGEHYESLAEAPPEDRIA
jgi:DNA-binding CsgD family transcriptional regulator